MMGVDAQRAAVTFMRAMRNCPTVVRVPAQGVLDWSTRIDGVTPHAP